MKTLATTISILILVILLVALSYRPQQTQAVSIDNCSSDLECEQVAAYTFDHDSAEVAQ